MNTLKRSIHTHRPMEALVRELLPHAPHMGLYVSPNVPEDKLRAALGDFASGWAPGDVLALYDATLLGGAKDGALFGAERFVFQNNDLEKPQVVRYVDVVRVEGKRKLLGGRKVVLDVNRGRSTFQVSMDFSGKPEAAEYVERFLKEAMLHEGGTAAEQRTDRDAVMRALDGLVARGALAPEDRAHMLAALDRNEPRREE